MVSFILMGGFVLFCALGVPVAVAMITATFAAAWYMDLPLDALIIKLADGTNQIPLLAVPLFVLAGAIMAEGGMAARLIALAKALFGTMKGGLSLVNVGASTLFGCISGSTVADTASIGSVMIPQMEKEGYPRIYATNVTMAGSLQALILPPSHNLIIYSLAAGGVISIPALFLAGIVPGLLMALSLALLCLYIARKHNYPAGDPFALSRAWKAFKGAFWGLLTMVIIMGGIVSGVFTATEAAGVACLYAFAITMFVYRDYRWADVHKLLFAVTRTCSAVMLMLAAASAFGYIMALEQIPLMISQAFLSVSKEPWVFLLLANIALIILGIFMELTPMLLICVPIFMPVITELGIDPVHFGVVMVLNLGVGLITPPVGATLFVGCAIGKVSMGEVTRTIWPFYVALGGALLIVTYVPALSLWLPNLMLGK